MGYKTSFISLKHLHKTIKITVKLTQTILFYDVGLFKNDTILQKKQNIQKKLRILCSLRDLKCHFFV